MFFVASKVFWMSLSPIVVLLILALVGASWSGDRWRRTFRSIGIAAILILIAVAMTPLGLMAAAPLENRFPQPGPTYRRPSGSSFWGRRQRHGQQGEGRDRLR